MKTIQMPSTNVFAKVIIFCLLASSLSLRAQSDNPFRFGIQGSPLINYISTDDEAVDPSASLKFGFGLMIEHNFADNYSFASGINIVNRGGRLRLQDTTADYQAQFLQLPLVLKMKSREFGYFTYFAEFGGSLDFELSEKVEFAPESFNPTPPDKKQRDSYIKPINAMFSIGGGVEYSLGGNTSLLVALHYNRSLIDNINEHKLVQNQNNYRFDYVSLKVGILF